MNNAKQIDWWTVKQCAEYARRHLPGVADRTVRLWIRKKFFDATLITLRTYVVDPESFKKYIEYRVSILPDCARSHEEATA